jgi:hypothetical protein
MGSDRMDNQGDDVFAHPKRRGSILLRQADNEYIPIQFRHGRNFINSSSL